MENNKDIRRIYMDIAEMLVSRQENSSKVIVSTGLVDNTDLLTAITSKDLVYVVIKNTFPAIDKHHCRHENFPKYLNRYFNSILCKLPHFSDHSKVEDFG